MCELFAVSARRPVNVNLSFGVFSRRGGETGPHADGWGIAFFEGRDVQLIRETAPAAKSPCARFVESHDLRSTLVLSHIRKATQGDVTLANTQPFTRTLGGRRHVFAHNGDLKGIERQPWLRTQPFGPIGDTDSELAFCTLMNEMVGLWERSGDLPALEGRLQVISTFARRIARLGPANFLYADSDVLFVHGHRRTQEDGTIRAPGLYLLRRTCHEPGAHEIEGVRLATERVPQEVVLVASRPLSEEAWQPLAEGEVVAIQHGRILGNLLPPHPRAGKDAGEDPEQMAAAAARCEGFGLGT